MSGQQVGPMAQYSQRERRELIARAEKAEARVAELEPEWLSRGLKIVERDHTIQVLNDRVAELEGLLRSRANCPECNSYIEPGDIEGKLDRATKPRAGVKCTPHCAWVKDGEGVRCPDCRATCPF